MIVFSGWKTFAILAGAGALMALLGESTAAMVFIGLLVTGAGFWVNAPRLNSDGSMYQETNSLLFIPIQWWGVVIVLVSLFGP